MCCDVQGFDRRKAVLKKGKKKEEEGRKGERRRRGAYVDRGLKELGVRMQAEYERLVRGGHLEGCSSYEEASKADAAFRTQWSRICGCEWGTKSKGADTPLPNGTFRYVTRCCV